MIMLTLKIGLLLYFGIYLYLVIARKLTVEEMRTELILAKLIIIMIILFRIFEQIAGIQ
jgi:hypothetical protein